MRNAIFPILHQVIVEHECRQPVHQHIIGSDFHEPLHLTFPSCIKVMSSTSRCPCGHPTKNVGRLWSFILLRTTSRSNNPATLLGDSSVGAHGAIHAALVLAVLQVRLLESCSTAAAPVGILSLAVLCTFSRMHTCGSQKTSTGNNIHCIRERLASRSRAKPIFSFGVLLADIRALWQSRTMNPQKQLFGAILAVRLVFRESDQTKHVQIFRV